MTSSCWSGRVSSRIAFSKSIRLIPIAVPTPRAAAAAIVTNRRRRDPWRLAGRDRGVDRGLRPGGLAWPLEDDGAHAPAVHLALGQYAVAPALHQPLANLGRGDEVMDHGVGGQGGGAQA